MDQADWWKTLFDQKYLETYLGDLTPERTNQEVDFVVKAAQLKPDDKILDLACGHGRHTIELAKRGFKNIVGLDYSAPFINKAKADAKKTGVEVEFVQGDMKDLPFNGEFDVVLTIFTTFGYFDDAGNQKTLEQISKALKPGGRFLIDVISAEAKDRRSRHRGKEVELGVFFYEETVDLNGRKVLDQDWYDSNTQLTHTHREWEEEGQKREYDFYLKVYTIPQYKEMIKKAGMEFKKLWGDFQGNPQGPDNHRTIILAEKSIGD